MRCRRAAISLALILAVASGCGGGPGAGGAETDLESHWHIDAGERCHALGVGEPVKGTKGPLPHAPAGGPVTDGTYWLVQAYLKGDSTMWSALRISGNRVQWAYQSDDFVLGRREYRHTGTFTTSGTEMTTIRTCEYSVSSRTPVPDGGLTMNPDPGAFPLVQKYSASGSRIYFFDGFGSMLVLQRR